VAQLKTKISTLQDLDLQPAMYAYSSFYIKNFIVNIEFINDITQKTDAV
jgi:hypothetical protein